MCKVPYVLEQIALKPGSLFLCLPVCPKKKWIGCIYSASCIESRYLFLRHSDTL